MYFECDLAYFILQFRYDSGSLIEDSWKPLFLRMEKIATSSLYLATVLSEEVGCSVIKNNKNKKELGSYNAPCLTPVFIMDIVDMRFFFKDGKL